MFTLDPPGNSSVIRGTTVAIRAHATYPGTDVDVSGVAQYVVRSGTSDVITVGSGEKISGVGNGTDFMDVSYMGWKASAKLSVSSIPAFNLSIAKRGFGTCRVTSDDLLLDCGAVCAHSYVVGAAPVLTATADTGSIFTGWSGQCTGPRHARQL